MVIFQSESNRVRHALSAGAAASQLHAKVGELNREFSGIYPCRSMSGSTAGWPWWGPRSSMRLVGDAWTFTASGPTTNLAARIADLTKGGEVKVGAETAERIKSHYVLEDTGEHQLKNVSQPVRVFRLVPAGVYRTVTT
jgi:class 3 adenylate cyclase